MNKGKKELLNARRKANQEETQVQIQQEVPPVDNRVRVATYINRKGKKKVKYCQDFKVVANDANACGLMWMGDHIENQPGHRKIVGQTFGIKEWTVEFLDIDWEEYLEKE